MAKKKRAQIPIPSAVTATPEGMPFTRDGIPKTVADQMVKRALIFGVPPTLLAFSTFPICYSLFKSGAPLPSGVVILISLGFVALGSGGAVFGMFSTPWTAAETYSFWGFKNVKINFQRILNALETEGEKIRIEKAQARSEKK
jgi:hypothetical protein